MRYLRVLYLASRKQLLACAAFSLCTGAASGLMMLVVSGVIATRDYFSFHRAASFFLLLALYLVFRFCMSVSINKVVEELTMKARLDILEGLQECALEDFERIGHEQIHTVLTDDCAAISRFVPDVVEMISGAVTLMVCMAYLLWLAPQVFFATLAIIAGGVGMYLFRQQAAKRRLSAARTHADRLYRFIVDFLGGFKELKLNQGKRGVFFNDHLRPGFRQTMALRIAAHRAIQFNYSLGLGMFFVFLGFVLFGMPHRYPGQPELVSRIAVVLLYMIMPGGQFFYCALQLLSLKVALEHLGALWERASFENTRAGMPADRRLPADPDRFNRIVLAGVGFSYPLETDGAHAFGVSEIDLEIEKGQVVFITGGNGSGKTTLSKIIAGLYQPQSGCVLRDGQPVDAGGADSYRGLFSFVFSDFYLFERIYSSSALDMERCAGWLQQLGLAHKVSITGGKLSTTTLSAGQRRRLALLVALVDDRPVLVVDEMTADQEADFRDYFYGAFLEQMKREGKTLIVITHDDRYFHLADRLVWMDGGRVRKR